MTSHPPTPEQQAILSAVKSSKDSMMVTAMAGTGKTSTLVMIANELPAQPAIALAFNVTIKKELERRFPSYWKIMTLNGLGHLAWMRTLSRDKKITLDERKLGRLVTAAFKDFQYQGNEDAWSNIRTLVTKAMQAGIVPASRPHKGFRPDTPEQWAMLADENWLLDMGETEIGLAREILTRSVAEGFEGTISFDDQIYLSCQPAGTMILAKRHKTVLEMPIERLVKGDKVIAFDRQRGEITSLSTAGPGSTAGSLVTDVGFRHYTGTFYRIYAGDKQTVATHDHKWLVRFNQHLKKQDWYFTYLMYKNGSYRVGQTQTRSIRPIGTDAFGFAGRCLQEGAEKGWLLGVHTNEEDARKEEAILAVTFGITDLSFRSEIGKSVHAFQRTMPNMNERAKRALDHYSRDINFPFWKTNSTRAFYSNFVTESCNLIPEIMQIPTFNGTSVVEWQDMVIAKTKVEGVPVYSLDIARHHTYIADGIITHNCCFNGQFPRYGLLLGDEVQDWSVMNRVMAQRTCSGRLILVGDPRQSIYQFRGADSSSMERLRALRTAWIDLPLSVTFRCPKVIVDRQQSHAPSFTAFHSNKIGEVVKFQKYPPMPNQPGEAGSTPRLMEAGPQTWSWPQVEKLTAHGTIAILCRNNAPLLKIAFRLLRQNTAVTMLGRDIGKTLIAVSKKVLPDDDMTAVECVSTVNLWRESQVALANANGQEEKVANLHDQAECLLAVIEGARAETASAIRWYLRELFERASGHVVISTIHRAKGLEWSTVLHLDPWRIPSKHAMQNPVQMQQEKNLLYVAETRCQSLLIEANLEDFE